MSKKNIEKHIEKKERKRISIQGKKVTVSDKFQRKYGHMSQLELIDEIKKLKKNKKYGVVWEENVDTETKEKMDIQNKNIPVLKEITKNNINKKQSSPNILIEGDNYNALSVLNYTHKEKIDVIYIDPPYNLGKEFTYNDKIVDKEDSYKHSKWLSFMKKRLELAKKLLSSKGVIFISIDDNEQAQLRLLCNEVFGEENFVANIIWQKKFSPQNDAKYFSDMHDFILVYAKKKNINDEKEGWVRNLLPRTEQMNLRYKNPDNDPRGNWSSGGLDAKTYSLEYDYPITTPSNRIVRPPKGTCWRFKKERFDEMVKDNRISFGKNGSNVPRIKRFFSEVQAGIVPTTWWDMYFAGHNQDAKQEFNRMNLKQSFDNPKPVKLIKKILEIASDKNSIILDFMAGSGTTGQAVLQLNKEDKGNRKFILCTNNENNICTNVCLPRLKKVMKGYDFKGKEKQILFEEKLTVTKLKKWEEIQNEINHIKSDRKNEFDEIKAELKDSIFKLIGINNIDDKKKGLGGNLRYFKTEFFEWRSTLKHKYEFTKTATELLCIKEDCFEKVKVGAVSKFKIFKNHNDKYLAIIYDYKDISDFENNIKEIKGDIHTYVFSVRGVGDISYFKKSNKKIKLKPIPLGIIEIYEKIIRDLKFS